MTARQSRELQTYRNLAALLACHSRSKTSPSSGADAATSIEPAKDAGPPMTPFHVKGLDALAHKPLVALWEMNPWLMVIGSDVPTVVVYEDGLVIEHKIVERKVDRVEGRMTAVDAQALASRVDAGLARSPVHSDVSLATDQPTVQILVRTNAGFRAASAYGPRAEAPTQPASAERDAARCRRRDRRDTRRRNLPPEKFAEVEPNRLADARGAAHRITLPFGTTPNRQQKIPKTGGLA